MDILDQFKLLIVLDKKLLVKIQRYCDETTRGSLLSSTDAIKVDRKQIMEAIVDSPFNYYHYRGCKVDTIFFSVGSKS